MSRMLVALSGGVDSSVAAALLKAEGHELVGVTLKLKECEDTHGHRSCCGIDGIARARAVAGQLSIPFYVLDAIEPFLNQVLEPAWREYEVGRTPSPCLACNERIKFGYLLDFAQKLGLTAVVTGHYARILPGPDGAPSLHRGVDLGKDQAYFLAGLTPSQLAQIRFPLGGMTKPEVREHARALGLVVAETAESQDACLVGAGESFSEVLRRRFEGVARPGSMVDDTGQVFGHHEGHHLFTVGQRKGLPIPTGRRRFVSAIHPDGTVEVTSDPDALRCERFHAVEVSGFKDLKLGEQRACLAQVRSRHGAAPAVVSWAGDALQVTLLEPVLAVTPGQAAVFFDGERVLGRGWIRRP